MLTYSARGFHTDQPSEPWQPATPSGSWREPAEPHDQLKSRDAEIRDTQWLSALAAATFPDLDRERVAVSGGSYGGGESWLHSTQPDWTFPHSVDPAPPVLELKVAVPKCGWSDRAYSLAPHGRGDSYTAATESAGEQPIGVVKLSYVNGFFAFGATDGSFEAGTRRPPDRGGGGADQRHGVEGAAGRCRRPLRRVGRRGPDRRAAPARPHRVPRQPLPGPGGRPPRRDALNPGLDRRPVPCGRVDARVPRAQGARPALAGVARVRDVGHPRAQNKAATWRRLNTQANAFLVANLHRARGPLGRDRRADDVRRQHRRAGCSRRSARARAADERFALPGAGLRHGDPDGVATDPVAGSLGGTRPERCRTSQAATWPGRYTALTEPLPAPLEIVGLGEVRIPYALAPSVTTTVAARDCDVAPGGTARLITRGSTRRRTTRRRVSCGSACSDTTGVSRPATGCESTSPRPTGRRSGARTSRRRSASRARSWCCRRAEPLAAAEAAHHVARALAGRALAAVALAAAAALGAALAGALRRGGRRVLAVRVMDTVGRHCNGAPTRPSCVRRLEDKGDRRDASGVRRRGDLRTRGRA